MGIVTSPDTASQPPRGVHTSGYVDWAFAKATGRRMVAAGPKVTAAQAAAVVVALRSAAERSRGPVAETARMHSPAGSSPVLIVDRPGWIDANVDSLQSMLEPVLAAMVAKRKTPAQPPSNLVLEVGGKVTGAEAGALMSFLSSKILGQYDLAPDATPRLLLVAPNVLHTETEIGVDPADFRLWVCLHEETHRVQFTAVPWMRDHIHGEIANLIGSVEVDPAKLAGLIGEGARRVVDMIRGDDSVNLLELIQSPEQKQVLDRITGVMSLLEGHADVVMDGVGPEVIPTVDHIRRKFNRRRKGAGPC